jgi:phage/plasmid-associated DNA primase
MRLLEKMLGEEKVYETTKPSRDVWGDFNGRMVNSFLVNLNELSKKETLDATNYIKGLITDPKLTINNKGVGQYEIQSYHRWLITTNNEDPIGSGKDDRRKVIIRSSDELIGNKEYFTIMNDVYLKDINVIKTCYEFFKNLDGLDKFLSLPMPITEYQGDIQELSVSPIENWLKDLTINTAGTEDANKIMEYNSKEIYEEFKIWIKQNAIQYELDSLKFLVRLKRLKINGVEKKHTKYGNKTIINLQELREHFFPN